MRRPIQAALLLLVAGGEVAAYYGMQSLVALHLTRTLGMEISRMGQVLALFQGARVVAPLLGGCVALLIPPRFSLVVGAFVAVGAYALMAVGPLSLFLGGLAILALALGLFRPALVSAAGELFPGRVSYRVAFFALYLAGVNAAALLSTVAAGGAERFGDQPVFAGGAVALVVVALAALGAAVLPLLLPDDGEEEEPPPPVFRPSVMAGSAILMAVALPSLAMATLSDQWMAGYGDQAFTLYWVDPAVSIPVALLVAGVFAATGALGRTIPVALPLGVGLVLTAATGILLLLPPGSAAIVAASTVGAVGETLISALVLARLSSGVHPRAQTLVVAVWLGGSALMATLSNRIPAGTAFTAATIGLMAFCLVAGVGVAAFYRPLEALFAGTEGP